MKLSTRQHKKRDQALDAFASVAKTWSEWRLGERATKTVAKGTKKASKSAAKARKKASKAAKNADASSVTNAVKGTPLKIAGAVALVAGVGAAVAKKLKGGGTAEPLYTPPPAPAPMPPPTNLKDVPPAPPTAVVVGDLADADSEPAASADDDAADAPADDAGESPVAASEGAMATSSGSTLDDVTEPTVPDTEPDGSEHADMSNAGDEDDGADDAHAEASADDTAADKS